MARRGTDSPPLFALPDAPNDAFEKKLKRAGREWIAGVDEAGRGPLAGPVVAAAVVLPKGFKAKGLDDSKKVAPELREKLHDAIIEAACVSVAVASVARIDRMNILRASLWAMSRAIAGLSRAPDHVLVDGNMLPPDLPCPGDALVAGDARSVSIAAASIVAKVTRDRLMARAGARFPGYGFERHMGYATPEHLSALSASGACTLHRRSFAPVRAALGYEVAGTVVVQGTLILETG